jgi:hypothetical protein
VLKGPNRAFAEGVVSPVPGQLFKQFNVIAKVAFRVWRPTGDTKFSDEDPRLVLLGEADYRLEYLPEMLFVPDVALTIPS